ncbi:MAG: C40 family peptidase [Cellulosilyticaceae bacterium]
MKKRGFIKAILVAATIALSSITVLATENSDVMETITETHKAYEIEATEAESYVKEGEIEIKEEVKPEESKPEVKEEVKKSQGEEVIEYAKQFIGTPYIYGGNSLTKGVDCSGFTSQVLKNFDVSLKRRSADQYSSNGTKVKKADLQAGDLVFYGYGSSVTHVGIYMGDSQVIHASTSHGVKIDPLDLRGMPPIMGYKRVL